MRDQPTSSTHPLLPPTTEDDRISWLRLLRSRRVGISTFNRLMTTYGSACAALNALPQIASEAGVQSYTPASVDAARREMQAARKIGAQMICRGDAIYPGLLAEIADAPPILWLRGTKEIITRPTIAIVGARNASSLGTRMTRALAGDLADAGFAIVSGLARGIDTCAHLASVKTGTIGVLAGGVDVMYPAENTALAEDMLKTGALLSEQPLGMAPIARHFPMRNRIISGLCQATIVVEAAAKSGSLITARGALDQGRDVLAVPGHPFDARASGCNMLLRDGAVLVRSAGDVIEHLGDPAAPVIELEKTEPVIAPATEPQLPLVDAPKPARSLTDTAALHQRILDRLGPSPVAEDQLMRDVGVPARDAMPALTDLELSGQIRRAPGGLVSRA